MCYLCKYMRQRFRTGWFETSNTPAATLSSTTIIQQKPPAKIYRNIYASVCGLLDYDMLACIQGSVLPPYRHAIISFVF